ncbi:MAG TPA: carboxymuconolactone decarboxylase family protein [Steroidobacteraceae bacterium]|jgi:alkyl hydroperoxide reductase subunit D|nr:carboxymuconolactone decarboxylase family protein [Steroidobacteraceae bacterium]
MDTTTLDSVRDLIPDYARDLKLNLGSVLTPTGAPGLNEQQIWSVALASAIASRNNAFTHAIEAAAGAQLDAAHLQAARAAAAIMGMNNIYYRFLHLVEDPEYQSLPARLRMNILGNSGIDKLDFELLSLAVSAINGCGLCVTSHEKKLRAHGITREQIQSAVRIAAVVHAVAGVLEYRAGQAGTVPDAVAA